MAGGMKRLAGETAIYGVSSIVGKFLNWMLVPMYTRVLATESDFGIVTNLYAWTALLMVILTYGMETGFFRFMNKKEIKLPMRFFAFLGKFVSLAADKVKYGRVHTISR